MALGNFPQAAKTAVVIARQEQELGNYKAAHSVLFDTFRDLEAHSIRVPLDLISMLTLLHSYLLVKKLVKVRACVLGRTRRRFPASAPALPPPRRSTTTRPPRA